MMSTTFSVLTLSDEDYLPGLGGLINSLRVSGFTGEIVAGVSTPVAQLQRLEGVRMVVLDRGSWMGMQKPEFLLREATEHFVFLDADIVVDGGTLFEALPVLTEASLALTLEGLVGPGDYRRLRWAARLGRPCLPNVWAYYNSGFVAGRLSRDRHILQSWADANRQTLPQVGGLLHDKDFPLADQDVLNGILQSSPIAIASLQFPDWWAAMTPVNPFFAVGALNKPAFYHSTGPKPWNLTEVPQRKPTMYESLWFRYAVVEATPVAIPTRLPKPVQNWLAHSLPSRVLRRTRRVVRQLVGAQ